MNYSVTKKLLRDYQLIRGKKLNLCLLDTPTTSIGNVGIKRVGIRLILMVLAFIRLVSIVLNRIGVVNIEQVGPVGIGLIWNWLVAQGTWG